MYKPACSPDDRSFMVPAEQGSGRVCTRPAHFMSESGVKVEATDIAPVDRCINMFTLLPR